jgi:hypothetical protein
MADQFPTELTEPAAVANYVATMTAELSMLAHHHGFETLGFLLEMARLEAENNAQKLNGGAGEG